MTERLNHGAEITTGRVNEVIDGSNAGTPQGAGMGMDQSGEGTDLYPVLEQGDVFGVITGRREIKITTSDLAPTVIQYEWIEVVAGRGENDQEIWIEHNYPIQSAFDEDRGILDNPAIELNHNQGIESVSY